MIDKFKINSKYKQVDSGGKYLNNVGDIGWGIQNKLNFIKDYKFVMSFENDQYLGYTTEKIMEPMCVGSIPIYYGSPLIHEEFNNESFITVKSFEDIDNAIQKIIEIDNNDDMFFEMQKKSNLINDEIQDFQNTQLQLFKLKNMIDKLLIEKTEIVSELTTHVNKAKFIKD